MLFFLCFSGWTCGGCNVTVIIATVGHLEPTRETDVSWKGNILCKVFFGGYNSETKCFFAGYYSEKNLCKLSSCRILFRKIFFVKYHPSSKTLSCPMLFCNIAHCGTLMKNFQQTKQSCKGTTCELKSPLVLPNVDEVVFGPTICRTMEWIDISHKQTQIHQIQEW